MSAQNVTIPTIPVEVADTIENLRNSYDFDNARITYIALRTGGGISDATRTLQKIPFDTLLAALVNGYEREMTEEERKYERVRERYLYLKENAKHGNAYARECCGEIELTLDTLGIVIDGINGEAA